MSKKANWEKMKRAYRTLLGKTNDAIESGRLQIEINQFKSKIKAEQRKIGEHIWEQHQEGTQMVALDAPFLADRFKDIRFYQEKVKEMEERSGKIFK